ncbi:PD-(D/E)XK motif protein [Schleiferiaceae bacterium]|nr:PD-(D/E)XK motif protein [Schleiferiaceae bacterium]
MRVRVKYYTNSDKFGTYSGRDWGFFLIGVSEKEVHRFSEFQSFEFHFYNAIQDLHSSETIEEVLMFNVKESLKNKFPFLKTWVNDYLVYVSEIETTKHLYSMLKSLSILFSSKSKDLSRIAQGLFAELCIFQTLLSESKLSAAEIIDGWQQADSKGLHDFKFGHEDVTIEVKSKIGSSMLVDFDSFEQLSQPQTESYVLSLVKLTAFNGVRLKDKINEIVILLDKDLQQSFNSKLFITSDGTLNLLKDFSFEVNAIVNYNLSQYKNSQLPRGVLVGKCKLDVKTLDETEARVNLLV